MTGLVNPLVLVSSRRLIPTPNRKRGVLRSHANRGLRGSSAMNHGWIVTHEI
jgi:hypothetical protein